MEKIKKGDGRESDWLIVIINREVKEKVSLKSDKKIDHSIYSFIHSISINLVFIIYKMLY